MHVNLLRTGVGVESIAHLHDIQNSYRQSIYASGSGAFLTTRGTPTRANDILNGGSVYWIIKQQICARQIVEDIQSLKNDEGQKFCMITMKPEIIMTVPVPHRHIQGWRYLPQDKAPQDFKVFDPTDKAAANEIDPNLAEELRAAGLL